MSRTKLYLPARGGYSTPQAADISNGTFRKISDGTFDWTVDLLIYDVNGNPAALPNGDTSIQVTVNDSGIPSVADIVAAADTKLRSTLGMLDGDPP